jgi:hypothetical protein
MYNVGSIDPDGMLNGAMTKLRNAHDSTASTRMKRSNPPVLPPSFFLRAAAAVRAARADLRDCIAPLVSAKSAMVKPDWQLRAASLCPALDGEG